MDDRAPSPLNGVDIDAVSAALNISRDDGRAMAEQMADEGWARCFYGGDTPRLRLTLKGHREIARLRKWPRWLRWLNEHAALAAFLTSALALIAAFLSLLLQLSARP